MTVRMHGNLRRFLPEGRESTAVEVEDGTTIDALLARLGARADTWLVAVNGTVTEQSARLSAGDLLECYEPVAGGRASRGTAERRKARASRGER